MASTDFTTTSSQQSFQMCCDARHPPKRQFCDQVCSHTAPKRLRKNPEPSAVVLNFCLSTAVIDSRFRAQGFLRLIYTMLSVERPLQHRSAANVTQCCCPREDVGSWIGEDLNSGPVWLGAQYVAGGIGMGNAGRGAGSRAVPSDFNEVRGAGFALPSSATNPGDDDTLHVFADDTLTDYSHDESGILGTSVAEECSHLNTPETLSSPVSTFAVTESEDAEDADSKTVPVLQAPDPLPHEVRSLCVTSTDNQGDWLPLDSQERAFTKGEDREEGRCDRQRLLQQKVMALREENQRLKARKTCVRCRSRPISLTLLPCGHLCLCTECGPSLDHCPLCHKAILADVRTFL